MKPSEWMPVAAEYMKELVKEKNLNLEEVAANAGVSRRSIDNLLAGKFGQVRVVISVVSAMGEDPGDFFGTIKDRVEGPDVV